MAQVYILQTVTILMLLLTTSISVNIKTTTETNSASLDKHIQQSNYCQTTSLIMACFNLSKTPT